MLAPAGENESQYLQYGLVDTWAVILENGISPFFSYIEIFEGLHLNYKHVKFSCAIFTVIFVYFLWLTFNFYRGSKHFWLR